ncbi:PfkB family carbohydrate kinase [Escherichia coli]|nr:PfkB family carbohydrate kinase [Escherichia coli]
MVTLDVRGVIAVKGNEQVKIGSYTIPVIDTTGAGDTFNGAFVYSLIKNMPLIEALKFASATAAINITALGAKVICRHHRRLIFFFHNTTKIIYIQR